MWATLRRALVAFSLAAFAKAAPVTLPFSENFDSASSVFLPASSSGTTWSYLNSQYRAAVTTSGVSAAATVQGPAMPTGFYTEAKLTIGTNGSPTTNTCGLGFLGSDAAFTGGSAAPYYLADIKNGASTLRIVKVGASNTFLINDEHLDFNLDTAQPFTISVECEPQGASIIISVVITQGANVSYHEVDDDSPLTGSYFGLRCRSNSGALTVDYDNYKLHDRRTLSFPTAPLAFAKPETAYNSTVTALASDGGNVTITSLQAPVWLSVSSSVNGSVTLSGTPPPGSAGTTILKFQAADGSGDPLVEEFPLTVLGVSGVIISEFAASNNGDYLDEDGDDSDWIELFNADSSPADLTGWKLMDDSATWPIPAGTTLPPFGTLVVFASDKDRTTPRLHTNFKLSSDAGGYLALARPDNSLASVYSNYPEQREGVSYGAWGTYETTGYLLTPTPDAVNAPQGVMGFTPNPVFSVPRGVYTTPQTLTISCPLPGTTMRYTLDGSDPTLTNGALVSPANATTSPTVTMTISSTSVVRAIAYLANYANSASVTHTYLFFADVITQSPTGSPPAGWPTGPVKGQVLDYGMDPDITTGKTAEMQAALARLPVFSLVTDLKNLMDPATGIYVNAYNREDEWERPTSIEMIKTDGSGAFQANCGVRMRGGVSRDASDPKHAFHLYFRGEYGVKKLDYPLFDSEGASSFDRIDLRCTQGNSWHQANASGATYMQDEWSRATQGAMGDAYNRGRYIHLFINGQYWGVYTTEERADDASAASYFGGEKEDYDVIKNYTKPDFHVAVADGTDTAWNALHAAATAGFTNDAAYYAVQGLDPNGQPSATLKPLLDVDNLIDYMLLNMFTGNGDGPVNTVKNVPKNFFCFRPRDGRFGFRFVAHDFEDTFTTANVTGGTVNDGSAVAGANLVYFNPRWLHLQLAKNARYRIRFGDLAQKKLFNAGALAVANATTRWNTMRDLIRPAMLAESARWGDAKSPATPHTVTQWESACNGIFNPTANSGYLTSRQNTLVTQLRGVSPDKLFPSINAPAFSQFGGVITTGFNLTITGPSSTQTYYTLNGTDPAAAGATLYSTPAPLNSASITVKARARLTTTGEWSALTEATFTQLPVLAAAGNLYLSELHYNPADGSDTRDFIEVRNSSNLIVDLTGAKLGNGVTFTFPALTLLPGESIVVVESEPAFRAFYGATPRIAGTWDGNLSNSGETIALLAANGDTIESVTYSDSAPWPTAPDGHGPSLVRIRPELPANAASSWRPSSADNGTPSASDSTPLAAWLTAQNLPDANALGADGLKALVHFASGTSPATGHPSPPIVSRTVANDTVTFRRQLSAIDDVRFFVEQSPDLASWPVSTEVDSAAAVITSRILNGDGTETIAVRLPAGPSTAFFRLRYVTR